MVNRGIRRHSNKTNLRKHVEYTTLWKAKSSTEERKGCAACFGHARRCNRQNAGRDSRKLWTTMLRGQQLRVQVNQMTRSQDRQRVGPCPVRGGVPVSAAGRPAPEDANMEAAEISAAQPTNSVVRTLEAEDDTSEKRERLMAGVPTLHQTDENFDVDAHKMVVVVAMPDDQGEGTQRVIDWDKKYNGAKSGNLLDTQKVYEGRRRELATIEKLEVAETIQLQEARAQNLETVYGKWLDDAKGTPEDPGVGQGADWFATQVNTYAREEVSQATPPIKSVQNHL